MMSDHWKAIARLLGAAGAAEPVSPPASPPSKPEAVNPKPAKPEAAKSVAPIPAAETTFSRTTAEERAEYEFPRDGNSGVAGKEFVADSTKVSQGGARKDQFGAGLLAEADAEKPAVTSRQDVEEKDDDLLNFSSFKDLDDERERPARELFGKAQEPSRGADQHEAESKGVKGLELLLGESEPSSEPSSWDKLVDRLGVEEPEERREARKIIQDVAKRPSESDSEKKLKGERSGFGAGLGFDFDEDAEEPFSQRQEAEQEVKDEPIQPAARRGFDWKPREDEGISLDAPDPLAEIGGEGWGRPKRKAKPVFPNETQDEPQDLGTGKRPAANAFTNLFDDEPSKPETATDVTETRESRPGRSGRRERSESVEGRSGRTEQRSGATEDRSSRDEARREERPVRGAGPARDDADDAESGARGGRRGQRQRMGEEAIESMPRRTAPRTSSREADDLFDFEDVSDDPMDGTSGPADDSELTDVDGESPTRRRRRGRRRRGSAGDSPATGERSTSETPAAEVSGRAIDAEFDDDHEDDEEAVVLRRSRRRRRRRSGAEPVESKEAGEFDDDVEVVGSVDSVVYDPIDDDEDSVALNTQRNVPTWLDAVDILVNTNIDGRKRDPKRPGGGSGGSGGSGSGGGRPRSRR